VTANGDGACALDIKTPVPYSISLTGQTSGTLMAYKIGDYDDEVFDQAGVLKSVRLDTPEGLGTVLKNAAVAAGSSGVDEDNPVGWVASRWLGYPTDPSSDDVTSAFSPYAGRLQLFAQALRDAVKADGDALGEVAGQLNGLDAPVDSPVTLPVSGPGLYLIVDSSGASLPIIVGTKVFNEALGDDGGFVDFADAGVKGKPRLGQAALKSDFADVYKRIVNDAGMDGFDVGSEVEYEIALRVPDLTKLDGSVSFDDYVFEVADVLPAGLDVTGTLASVRVFAGDVERTGDASVTLQDGRLTVSGLKALFAVAGSSPVVNDTGVVPVNGVVRIRYAAVLADGALLSKPGVGGLKPNANTVTLTRSTGPTATEEKTATANAYTFTVDVVKLDKDDLSTRLGGVEFEVSRDGEPLKFVGSARVYRLAVGGETGSATTVTTKADGTLSLQGVEARELSFKETTAPSDYFRVSDFTVDIRPEWNEDATQITKVAYATSGTNLAYVSQDGRQVMVLDPAWSLANLPYTGGIGILALLIVGGLMLVFAVRPYVLSKRAERDANLV
jgi:fimbrial isopeptide formation D2 family protein